ncbi:MAG: SH3 domain-containing protein, partial [Chloroflexi bacterium]|nr:SH3 domain-containing protein [Chloroflexota bacterium]
YIAARGLDPTLLTAVQPIAPVSTEPTPGFTWGSIVRVQGTGTQGLLLRSGPGLSNPSLILISEGTVLQIRGGPQLADGYTWWQVSFEGGTGWVAGDFLAPVD